MTFENRFQVTLEPLSCLRVEYLYNDCRLCLDACPQDALLLDRRSRVELESEQCIDCGVCIGVCLSEVFQSEAFDPNAYVIKKGYDGEVKLSCKEISACLKVFNEEHLLSLRLRGNSVVCDMSECQDCPINTQGNMQADIEQNINQANVFLEHFGFDLIQNEYTKKELDRRGAITKIFKETKSAFTDEPTFLHKEKNIPQYRAIFQNSLKYAITKIEDHSLIDFKLSNISHKQIAYESCDNCGECVQFCPTKALTYSSDETKILFAPLHCISCGICSDICKPNAIHKTDKLDIVFLAFDRAEILIEHTFATCSECRVSFPRKKDEKVCARCASFVLENSDLFKLEKDM